MSMTPASRSRLGRILFVAGFLLIPLGIVYGLYSPELFVFRDIMAARRELSDGRPRLALVRLEQLDRRYPNRGDIAFWLAVANRRQDQLSAANDLLARAELLGFDEERIVLQRALIQCRGGGIDQVEPLLRQTLVQGVDDETAEDIYDAMASGFIVSFRLKDAWQCLDYWITWQPFAIKPRLLRAAINVQLGNRDAAREDYEAVVGWAPQDADLRLKYAQILLDLNRGEQALSEFSAGHAQHPDRMEFRVGIANCQRALGRFDEAKQALNALLKERLSSSLRPEVLRLAGEVAVDMGNVDEAITFLHSAERLTPRDPQIHRDLTRAFSIAGKPELAQQHRETFDRLSAATSRLREIANQLVEEPHRVDLRYEAGAILLRNEFPDDAIGWWLSALRIDPQHRATHRALAEVYAYQGKTAAASFHRRAAEQAGAGPRTPSEKSKADDEHASPQATPVAQGAADGTR